VLWAENNEVTVERHPTDKDVTDTALALALALALGADHLVVYGGTGIDRFDHLLGTVVAFGDPSLAPLRSITSHLGASTLHVLHAGHDITLDLPHGDVFSLVSLHGRCSGVEVRNARWPLEDATLPAGSTRGISNESLGLPLHISTADGVLTVIVPRPEHPSASSFGSPTEHA
jgi:thiamine pyrophosphokinase